MRKFRDEFRIVLLMLKMLWYAIVVGVTAPFNKDKKEEEGP